MSSAPDGEFRSGLYRSPVLTASTPCNVTDEEFAAARGKIEAVLEKHGGVVDTIELATGLSPANAEVKWLDRNGATISFASAKKTVLSLHSAELPTR